MTPALGSTGFNGGFMTFPEDIGVIDTMMGTTAGTTGKDRYAFLDRALKDAESANMNFPAQYMFKDVPFSDQARDADGNLEEPPQGPDLLLPFMDRCNVEIAMVGIRADGEGEGVRCVRDHPDRFVPCHEPDPNDGVEAIRTIRRLHDEHGLKAVTAFPSGRMPQVRHGCEPWEDLAVKLMLKWPGLHYSTSAFAPKHYPKAIIDYANTRGADKIIYGGYFPMGLSLDRIFEQLRGVPFKDDVWPKFLRDNARRVLRLD